MPTINPGKSAAIDMIIVGRPVIGLDSELDLAVNETLDLQVDLLNDLAVRAGVHWTGIDATERVYVRGAAIDLFGSE